MSVSNIQAVFDRHEVTCQCPASIILALQKEFFQLYQVLEDARWDGPISLHDSLNKVPDCAARYSMSLMSAMPSVIYK